MSEGPAMPEMGVPSGRIRVGGRALGEEEEPSARRPVAVRCDDMVLWGW